MRFFSPPEKPTLTAAAQHVLVDAELARDLAHALHEFGHLELGLAALLALRVERGAQERHGGDAGNFQRILEGEKKALGGALVGRQGENVLAVEQHLALGDVVVGLAGEHMRERRLARAVRAHDGVHLPFSTVRSRPLRIFLPSTSTCRFLISSRCIRIDFLALIPRPEDAAKAACRRSTEFAVIRILRDGRYAASSGCGLHRQPTLPSRLIEISFCASTANSIGSCCSTSLTKPLTTSATASSADRPRCRQ